MLTRAVQIGRLARSEILNLLGVVDRGIGQLQLATGLRALGFEYVFDSDISSDLFMMEEVFLLLACMTEGGPFPIISANSPGFREYLEEYYPEIALEFLSTCKSPQQMMGSLVRNYRGEMSSTIIVPQCIDSTRRISNRNDYSYDENIDEVMATTEIAELFERYGINISDLEEERYDDILGGRDGVDPDYFISPVSMGSSIIEELVRDTYDIATGTQGNDGLEIEFEDNAYLDGLKDATIMIADLSLKVSVFQNDDNLPNLMDYLEEMDSHYVEVLFHQNETFGERQHDLSKLKRSYDNQLVEVLYKRSLGAPGSPEAKELLHIEYI